MHKKKSHAKLKFKSKNKAQSKSKSTMRRRLANLEKVYVGTVEITRRGTGYVLSSELPNDIFIPSKNLSPAWHGDQVKVVVLRAEGRRIFGKIVKVIKRKQRKFVAKIVMEIQGNRMNYSAVLSIADYSLQLPLQGELNSEMDGARALIEIHDSGSKTQAKLLKVLPADQQEHILNSELLLAHGFPLEFAQDLQNELANMQETEDLSNPERVDYTQIFTCTIDPEDAKDFDDALSVEWLDDGGIRVGVHIADVSFFVRPKTQLDQAALARATSVYLPSMVAPMLPEKLSNHICSLVPNQSRLAFAAIFDLELASGKICRVQFMRTRILSKRRFSYAEVQNIIDTGKGEYAREILTLNQLAQQWRAYRMQHGSINFNSAEQRFVLDENCFPIEVLIKKMGTANQLVEEFMLAANCAAAKYLSEAGKKIAFPFRVHAQPDLEKLERFEHFVRKRGYDFQIGDFQKLPNNLNKLLQEATEEDRVIFDRLGIRTMAKAVYSSKNVGHYGLGAEFYTHFTSPIRRYPDILTHRALTALLSKAEEGSAPLSLANMEALCEHCSERERAAMECERSANRYKQVQWLSKFVGQAMDGIISGINENGFWVETLPHHCEGMVSIQSLPDGQDLVLVAEDFALKHISSKRMYQMGQRVRVRIVHTDLERREVDMELVE